MPTSTPAPARPRRPLPRPVAALWRDKVALAATAFIVLLVVIAVVGPMLTKDPNDQSLVDRLQSPSSAHWLGTDRFGRDALARLVSATGVTLLAGIQSVGLAVVVGVPSGLAAGYLRGRVGAVFNWVADTLISIPPLILALAIIGIRGTGLTNAMIAIGVILMPRFYRVARAEALSIRSETYVEAAVSCGCTTRRILLRHVLPNASGPLLVQASFSIGLAIVAEASLSFLGLGVQDPQASWGSIIRDAFDSLHQTSFGLFPASIMITLTIAAFAVLGDSVRDSLGRTSAGGDRP